MVQDAHGICPLSQKYLIPMMSFQLEPAMRRFSISALVDSRRRGTRPEAADRGGPVAGQQSRRVPWNLRHPAARAALP